MSHLINGFAENKILHLKLFFRLASAFKLNWHQIFVIYLSKSYDCSNSITSYLSTLEKVEVIKNETTLISGLLLKNLLK